MSKTHTVPRYTTSTLCAVAGCTPATFRGWRNRNGLFPETRVEGTNKTPWNTFSRLDICIARLVNRLVETSLSADKAVKFASGFGAVQLDMLLSGEDISWNAVQFETGSGVEKDHTIFADPSTNIATISQDSGCADIGIYIDFLAIIEHVVSELKELAPETIATKKETLAVVASALAKGFKQGLDDETS